MFSASGACRCIILVAEDGVSLSEDELSKWIGKAAANLVGP